MTYSRMLLVGFPVAAFALIGGCRRNLSGPPSVESVRFGARAEVIARGDSLSVRAVATNTGRSVTWRIELGHCSMTFRVATLPPVPTREWDYLRWRIALNPKAVCLAYLESWRLRPRDSLSSRDLERSVHVRDVLGDSLPQGRYRVTALVAFNNQSSGELAAGEVELRTPR